MKMYPSDHRLSSSVREMFKTNNGSYVSSSQDRWLGMGTLYYQKAIIKNYVETSITEPYDLLPTGLSNKK